MDMNLSKLQDIVIPKIYQISSHTFSKDPNRFPNLGVWQRDWEAQEIWLWRPVGFHHRIAQDLETDSWRDQTKPCVCQEKGAVTPQKTGPDLPVSVEMSLAEAWVNSQGHWIQQSWEMQLADISPFEAVIIIITIISLPQFDLRPN